MNCNLSGAGNVTSNIVFGPKGSTFALEALDSTQTVDFRSTYFTTSTMFKGSVQLPNGPLTFSHTFQDCTNFNSPVEIPKTAIDCGAMFSSCRNFNSPVTFLGNNVRYCGSMFSYCYNFDKPVNIPEGVTHCNYMFYKTYKLKSSIRIPYSVMYLTNMFNFYEDKNHIHDNNPLTIFLPEFLVPYGNRGDVKHFMYQACNWFLPNACQIVLY